jgi:autotransporter-associated beta strand protein
LTLLAASVSAQTVGFTTDTTAEQYGSYQTANGGLLNIGRAMTVSGSGIEVLELGVFDYQGEPLAAAHTVTLFDSTQTPVASVTVPAGTAAPLINAFRFAPLATPVFLPAGNYSILAYQMSASDPYGNGNAPGFNGGGNVSPGNGIYDFTAAGSPDYPNGGDINNGWSTTAGEEFAAVSFTYTNVPPATGIWTGGGADNNWSTAGNWNGLPTFPAEVTFAGSTRLTNTNDFLSITVSGVTFDSAAGAFVLNGNDITLAGSIGFSADGIGLSANPPAPVTQTINLNMALTTDVTIDTPTNGNLTLGGNLTSANALTKMDNGTLSLGGVDTFSTYDLNNGTNIITGNVTIDGTGGNSRFYLANANSAYNSTLIIQPGATLNITGSFGDSAVIGRDGGSGTVIQNGGTFTFNCNQPFLFVGATSFAGTRSEYDMNGGVLDLSGNNLATALGDQGIMVTGVVSQASGIITNVASLQLGALLGVGHGVYTLTGGSIFIGTNTTTHASGITTVSGDYAINLGGGTVGAQANWASSLNINLTGINGAVTFDPAGNTMTLSGVLSGNGGLIVAGGGTLALSGANTYTGDTIVNAGSTLQVVPGVYNFSSSFRLTNGATLNVNGSGPYVVAHFYTNGVALPNGVYSAGTLGAFISGHGSLQVGDVAFSLQPQNQLAYLNVNQSVTLTSQTVGASATYQWYLNGQPVAGATGTNLTLSHLQMASAGNLYMVATSGSGSVTSSVIALTIYGENNNVFAYEGFDYDGSTDGSTPIDDGSHNGGLGWAAAWTFVDGAQGNSVVVPASLVGGTKVPNGYDSRSIGNSLWNYGGSRVGRYFDTSSSSELFKQGFVDANGNIGANGKTIYLSFLQEPNSTASYYELGLKRGSLSDPGRIGGITSDPNTGEVYWRTESPAGGGSTWGDLGSGDANAVDFYVVRIDFKAGNDDMYVYRNPTSATEPAVPTYTLLNAADMSLSGISVDAFVGPQVGVDEIRLGATWADAVGLAVSNLLPPSKIANGYKVQFACTPGNSYRIQRATNVTGPWTDIQTVVGPESAFIEYEDTSASSDQSFYRTVTP